MHNKILNRSSPLIDPFGALNRIPSQQLEVAPNFVLILQFSSTEAVAQRCSVKKVILEISQNVQENTCARVSFLIKFIKKQTLVQVFSCEISVISKSTFFYRKPLVAASELSSSLMKRARRRNRIFKKPMT